MGQQLASPDFEPWEPNLLERLSTKEQWLDRMMAIRLAAHIPTKSKAEVVEAVRAMEQTPIEEGDQSLAVHLIEGIDGTRDELRYMLAICDQAFARALLYRLEHMAYLDVLFLVTVSAGLLAQRLIAG